MKMEKSTGSSHDSTDGQSDKSYNTKMVTIQAIQGGFGDLLRQVYKRRLRGD